MAKSLGLDQQSHEEILKKRKKIQQCLEQTKEK